MSRDDKIIQYDFRYNNKPESLIDKDTLLYSQLHIIETIRAIQKSLYPYIEIHIAVVKPQHGSSTVSHIYDVITPGSAVNDEHKNTIEYAEPVLLDIFITLNELYQIKKLLQGRKADDDTENGDSLQIIRGEKHLVTTKKIFSLYANNPILNTAIINYYTVLSNDNNINGITITKKDEAKPVIEITKVDFPDLIAPNDYLNKDDMNIAKKAKLLFNTEPEILPGIVTFLDYSFMEMPGKGFITDKIFL